MKWSDLKNDLAAIAPVAGGLIGGPAGSGVGEIIAKMLGVDATPDAVSQALKVDPDAAVKLRGIDAQVQIAQITASAQQVDSVNKTLQTEAMGGSFWQRNHHAFESTFALLLIFAIYFVLPAISVPVPVVPAEVWLMIGGVLGVTAWQRGVANAAVAKGTDSD